MIKKLVLIGAGGHAKSCVGVIESCGQFEIHGFIDTALKPGERVLGYPVLGGNEMINELQQQGDVEFIITVGQIRSGSIRVMLFELLEKLNACIVPKIIAESAVVSKHSTIGRGTIAMHNVIVNADARVGDNVILNNNCLIEHDSTVGNHTHISTGAIINGGCTVGNRVFVGSGAVLVQGITVADDVVIGAGAVVTSSITEPGTYVGNPGRKINQ